MFATAEIVQLPVPETWVVIDLETGDAPEAAITAALDAWKAPSNWKPETVTAKRAEAAERIRERSALLDASPILCLAINTETEELVINGMDQTAPDIRGWNVWPRVNERGLLLALRSWLDQHTGPETVIVGHNIRGFDLPKLRHAYLRHRLKLPALLAPRINDSNPAPMTVDTAALFKAYSMEHRDDFCPSLDAVAASLGITRPKGVINGSDVPALHRDGKTAEILTYCAIDCATTARAYRLMSGQAEDLE